jgi:hypothetical protein
MFIAQKDQGFKSISSKGFLSPKARRKQYQIYFISRFASTMEAPSVDFSAIMDSIQSALP